MGKILDLFKRKEKIEDKIEDETENKENVEYEIRIQGKKIGLFKDEEEKIMQGAKSLLEYGFAENMIDAIKTFGTMIRGLKCSKDVEYTEDGKIIITFIETAVQSIQSSNSVNNNPKTEQLIQEKDDFNGR